MKRQYDHQAIEKDVRARWAAAQLYEVDPAKAAKPFYCLDMFPYPSGDGLHVGHWRGYVLSDFYARYYRLKGFDVLHPMGFDAFGLPAERAAIKHKSHPKKFTDQAIKNFLRQLDEIGAAYDHTKTINTSDLNYYHWTQWLFLQFLKHDLAEKRKSLVNWCPNDQTVLANEQVIDGCCERCGAKVTKKELEQWYLKTTAFASELVEGLDKVNWSENVKTLQRNWIGKSEGATVKFTLDKDKSIEVFTTRPDTIYGVTALVLAPEHPLAESLLVNDKQKDFEAYQKQVAAKTNVMRSQGKESAKTAFFTGSYAVHPLTSEKIPVWLADYVLMEYGTGAVMSVPAHDERDFMFARTHNLPIRQVIAPNLIQSMEPAKYRPSEPVIRGESVIVFIKHPKENKYLGLDWIESAWGAKTLLTGTIDDLSPEETLKKEIVEETGFQNFKIMEKLGVIDGLFYHLPKKTNKLVRGHVYVVQLENEKKENVADHEAARHDMKWLTPQELKGFLTPASHQLALGWLDNGYKPFTEPGALMNSGQFNYLTSQEASEKIVAELEKKNLGQKTTTYRLRDWLVSRQRYWGAPIPVVYDPDGQAHPVKDEHLPLELPTDVDFLPGGVSPLARSHEFKQRAEKLYGKGWHFETDTLDTFVDSSWYFMRYLSPADPKEAFKPGLVKKWLPIDLYIGGIEHATLHLLYARFVTKFLARYGYIDQAVDEPIKQLFNIGMITLHGAKMSKSKGNVISPDELVEHYGTDALRGYELFIGPMDVEAEWNTRGINGVHRFLISLYNLPEKLNEIVDAKDEAVFNKYLAEIEPMIKDFRLNTFVSSAMKLVNLWQKQPTISQKTFEKFVVTLSPAFPFIAEDLYQQLGNKKSVFAASWPEAVKVTETQQLSVLVNQRFVAHFTPKSSNQAEIEAEAQALPAVTAKLSGKKVVRVIFRAGQLVNVITG